MLIGWLGFDWLYWTFIELNVDSVAVERSVRGLYSTLVKGELRSRWDVNRELETFCD